MFNIPRIEEIPVRTLLIAWLGSGAFTVIFPLIFFCGARLANNAENDNEEDNGCHWWQWGCNGDENENENENNNEDKDENNNGCRWWQWGCNNNNNEEDDREEERQSAWWWFWSKEERRREDGPSGSLVFIYIWSLLLFGAILFYGYHSFQKGDDLRPIMVALAVFANLSFLAMFFLVGLEGGVQADGPEMEEDGWYGQLGVLMFVTYFWWILFSIMFGFICFRRNNSGATENKVVNGEPELSDYRFHSFQDAETQKDAPVSA